ncbi:formylmethanofuran dehydrogenase subunit A [Methanomicrobium sp. W14]|uniref:formylmethanofuran dehydrogenase subunit A n=1 Tax=Methanomicrobium sp. W14 TaxID=2817839 RepID=UPI001AE5ED63|nr:formylmethanofuran dehydrogenase subunit A [Methanomicrobium sp. W14]MBP2134060.1 formylmethanofuran dehydrogenase subunit A [Methanomicrobium sp. W14]
MSEYIIKNGFVFDPLLGIKGEKKDIGVKDGKIVDASEVKKGKVIDASGKTVMAGGVDIHTHCVGPKVNIGRLMRPEDKLFRSRVKEGNTRVQMGFAVPSTFATGYEYARMGYVYANEAAMPPLDSPHIHEEIRDTPIIDISAMPVLGNNWFQLEYLKNKEFDNNAAYTAWLLNATKGFGIKCVNPGGSEAWGWGMNCTTIHDPVPYFDITPAEIIKGQMQTNEELGLPHSLHIHPNNIGNPGNYETTLDTLKLAEGVKTNNKFGRDQVLHNTHLQFHSYDGTGWGDFCSASQQVMDYVNKQKNISFDLGCVTFDETTTMTADGPFEYHLQMLNHLKWANSDVELETSSGIVPYVYDPKIKVCDIQWAIGLELALLAKDHMRCHLTTDHPNAGPFFRYPRIIKWLMSKKSRDSLLHSFKWADKVIDATILESLDRELNLYEIAQMTRAGTAKCLGISDMYGSLREGTNANIAIYNINPEDMPSDPELIEKAFAETAYTIKDGVIVVENGKVVATTPNYTVWTHVRVPDNPIVDHDIREKFAKYYTVGLENYMVFDEHVHNPRAIEVDTTA